MTMYRSIYVPAVELLNEMIGTVRTNNRLENTKKVLALYVLMYLSTSVQSATRISVQRRMDRTCHNWSWSLHSLLAHWRGGLL